MFIMPFASSASSKLLASILMASSIGALSDGNYCGVDWVDAVSRCAKSCPTGDPAECMTGETCFSGTPCNQTQVEVSETLDPATLSEYSTPPPTVLVAQSSNSEGTCGGGQLGNGICPISPECCSTFGYCGTTPEHCSQITSAPQIAPSTDLNIPPSTGGAAPSVYGTCGGGDVGNGICANNNECCSMYGFCGTALEHCTNKVGSFGPNYPDGSQTTPLLPPAPTPPPIAFPTSLYPQISAENNTSVESSQPNNPTVYNPSLSNHTTTQQTSTQSSIVTPHGTNKRIIGYYAGWQWYDRNKLADPKNMDFKKVQRVNYAFFQPDSQGNIFGTDRWADPQLLFGPYSEKLMGGIQKCSYDGPDEVNCAYHEYNSGIIYLAQSAGAEIYPSIGGWTLSDNFPALSANPVARDTFAKNCAEMVEYYGFQGIDIDWEYPGYADHSGTPEDTVNFTKLLSAIRAALDLLTHTTGKVYGLTAALPCNPEHIANVEVSNLLSVLSEWNLMSYDFFGAWDNVTGVNAPLYPQGFGNDEFSLDRCVKNYMELGVPREKLNIGLSFYGRSFKLATELNQPHSGSDVTNWPDDDGSPQFFNIYKNLPNMIQVRDNKSKTQYAYTQPPFPPGLVSFDDERSICDKVHYAQKEEMGGFIIWELSGDLLDNLYTPLLDITNEKLGNPAFECCMLHSVDECEKEKAADEMSQDSLSSSQSGFDGYLWVEQNEGSDAHALAPVTSFVALLLCFLPIRFISTM